MGVSSGECSGLTTYEDMNGCSTVSEDGENTNAFMSANPPLDNGVVFAGDSVMLDSGEQMGLIEQSADGSPFESYGDFPVRMKQRGNPNRKEKKRTECINKAFAELRRRIPNVPVDTKLSKIKTLRLATSYITYLTDIIKSSDPTDSRDSRDFRADLKALRCRERRRRLDMSDLHGPVQSMERRSDKSILSIDSGHVVPEGTAMDKMAAKSRGRKRRKGRTGWPETVWAMELENNVTRNGLPQPHVTDTAAIPFILNCPASDFDTPACQRLIGNNNFSDTFGAFRPGQEVPAKYPMLLSDQHDAAYPKYDIAPQQRFIAQNTAVFAIGARNEVMQGPMDVLPSFSSIAKPALTQRLPPIPHFLHGTLEGSTLLPKQSIPVFTQAVTCQYSESNSSSPAIYQSPGEIEYINNQRQDRPTDETYRHENNFCYTVPNLTELKTVSVASIKISTSTVNGFATITTADCPGLQCLEATPVEETVKWDD